VLSQLHSLGVRISLDDFGTGYSSLSYLHNFPLQKVKIDRSFLEGIDSDRPLTLLRGVARLSADLGMSVVVEGIETNEQLELISADGAGNRGARLSVQPAGARGAGPPVAECLAWPPSAGGAVGLACLAVHRLIPVKIRGIGP
jgi:predicted signal transduction protein with EAL and GGDEF domain